MAIDVEGQALNVTKFALPYLSWMESRCPEQRDKAVELPIIIFNTQMMLELPRQRSNTRVLPGSKQ
uniref:Uncharacterized protein n=1 Tax=Romanomermis culicivorax TaxID=13658 RepID=A0A915LET1_ROMCU